MRVGPQKWVVTPPWDARLGWDPSRQADWAHLKYRHCSRQPSTALGWKFPFSAPKPASVRISQRGLAVWQPSLRAALRFCLHLIENFLNLLARE